MDYTFFAYHSIVICTDVILKKQTRSQMLKQKNPPAQFAVLWILIWHPQILYHGRGCEHITYSLYKV